MTSNLAIQRPETRLLTDWRKALDLDVTSGEISKASRDTYSSGMNKFYSWLTSSGFEIVSPEAVKTWKSALLETGVKPTTVNTWLAGVRRFFDWASGNGLIAVNPTQGVKGAKRKGTGKTHLRAALSDAEVLRVLTQPDQSTMQGKRDYCILSLKAYCGLRDVELHRADLADLDTETTPPILHVQGKGASEKDDIAVIFHSKAQAALYDWLAARGSEAGALFQSLSDRSNGERLGLSAIRHMVKGYYHKAGIFNGKKTSHSLRHSAISKVAKHDLLKARQVARHVSIDTTMIYVHEQDRLSNPGEAFIDYGE